MYFLKNRMYYSCTWCSYFWGHYLCDFSRKTQ